MNLKNFTECSKEELEMILSWRNSPEVRESSFNSDIIKLEDHMAFVSSLGGGGNEDKAYFLLSDAKGYAGVVSFTGINPISAEIGYYKNPERKEKGMGIRLLEQAAETAKNELGIKEIVTEAFSFNIPSLKSIERSGFIKIKEEQADGYFERFGDDAAIIIYKRIL